MKWLLLAFCLLGSASMQAQQTPVPNGTAPYRYCALVVNDYRFSGPNQLYLDYGQGAPGAVADPEMAEMTQNTSKSQSIIDILNYLSRHQWELFTVTNVPGRISSGSNYVDSQTRYLLRRRLP